MSTLSRKRIRLLADQSTRTSDKISDVLTSSTPELWRGNDVQFEIGLAINEVIRDDISNLASVSLTLRRGSAAGAELVTKSVAAAQLTDISQAQWTAGTHQHALVVLTREETAWTLTGSSENLWLVVSQATNDAPGRDLTIQHTILKFVEDGTGTGDYVTSNPDQYYTKSETDARYLQKHEDQAWAQWLNGRWYHYIQTTDLWYPEVALIKDGIPIITLGTGVSL